MRTTVLAIFLAACTARGPQGDAGPQGPKGDKGDPGTQGPSGSVNLDAGVGIVIDGGVISVDGSALTSLNASSLTTGTVDAARLPATVPQLSGGTLSPTVLPASVPQLSGGRLSDLVLPTDVPLLASGKLQDSVLPADVARRPTGPGASASAPASSCKAIKLANPLAQSGIYFLQVAGARPFPAFCDMDDDGGGWTQIYAGRNANPRQVFSNLGGNMRGDCQSPQTDCVRLLGTDRTESNTEFAASCGDAMIKFTLTQTSVKLLRDGVATGNGSGPGCGLDACGYQPLGNMTVIYGTLPYPPDTFYSGTNNPGWFIITTQAAGETSFASGYSGGYSGCNFVPDRGAQASLYWREVP